MCHDKEPLNNAAINGSLERDFEDSAKPESMDGKATAKRWNRTILVACCIVATIITCAVIFYTVTKAIPYENACKALEAQQYAEAIELFSDLGDYKDSQDLALFSRCELGIEYMNAKDFAKARQVLKEAGSYQRALELLNECGYQEAISYYTAKNYKKALQLFQAMESYKDSLDYISKIYWEQKYETFDPSGEGISLPAIGEIGESEMAASHDMISTQAECEEILQTYFYGTWYDETTGEPFIVDQMLLNGKRYCVLSLGNYLGEYYDMVYYEPSAPNILYYAQSGPYLNYPFHVDGLSISLVEDDQLIFYGMNITPEEYREQELAWEAQQPQYTDNTIIDETAKMVRSKLSAGYGAQSFYHSLSINSSNVEYDWTTQTYTCQLSITYSTNMFDLFGTSSTSYFVEATYKDTGYGLSMISFFYY